MADSDCRGAYQQGGKDAKELLDQHSLREELEIQ